MLTKELLNKYTPVVGLEVHAQLLTNSKMYCTDQNQYGSLPNTNIGVITLGHPGTLPMVNRKAIEYGIKMGLACGCAISRHNYFARKNYFYPDLPKGYQISQDKTPLCMDGSVDIMLKDGSQHSIRLTRIHLEEDAGKSIHLDHEKDTLVDFNRAGVPLIEVVTEPDIRSSEQAYALLTEIRKLVRYLAICDGNMEEGSLRCDANISVMPKGSDTFGNKVEVKNMNSIRNVQRAIEFEIERQIMLVEKGETIVSETRTFDAIAGVTHSMRTKEDLNDYRYFPEPDIAPLHINEEWINQIKAEMPSLPQQLFRQFTQEFGLPTYDAQVLTDTKEIALYFEEMCKNTSNYKAASNWMMGPIKSYLNELTLHIKDFPLSPKQITKVIAIIDEGKMSFSAAAQKLFPELINNPQMQPIELAKQLNLLQESDLGMILPLIEEVLEQYPDKVAEYKSGRKNLIGLFMGEVMKKSRGKADPKATSKLLKEKLEA